jgi:GIY-YIG catalytic domain-containing protein
MLTVIYAVECLRNGFAYVGLSSDYKRRWRQHRSELRRGLHRTANMLVDWRKYGESDFGVRVLEVLPYGAVAREAEKAELRWQAHFGRLGRLYNEPKCIMCGRPLENAMGTSLDVEAPDAGRAGRHAPAGHMREPPAERAGPAEPRPCNPAMSSNR